MRWFRNLRASRKWRYIGTVEARTEMVDPDKPGKVFCTYHGFWVLTERGDGRRKARKVGDAGKSRFAIRMEAEVTAWLSGGPLPELCARSNDAVRRLTLITGGKS